MNRLLLVLWVRKYIILLTAIFCIPIYYITNMYEGYYICAGLILAWSFEQIFQYSRIDKLKERLEK